MQAFFDFVETSARPETCAGANDSSDALERTFRRFPSTRYQGSKRKLATAIVRTLADLEFQTVLDAFGGTGSVAYAFKAIGKSVTYNDSLAFNHQIGLALIENEEARLSLESVDTLGIRRAGVAYSTFIEDTFSGIYFNDDENRWLDTAVGNIQLLEDRYQRALAWFAVFQAALAKRPYNLFHRRNLYMRLATVERGFGNKRTWDRSFPELVRRFAMEANEAVLATDGVCRAVCTDVLKCESDADLVYLDPPYVSRRGIGIPYRDFYHFLEGIVRYDEWPELLNRDSRHRAIVREPDVWSDPRRVHQAFGEILQRWDKAMVAISYRNDGLPTIDDLVALLRRVKSRVHVVELGTYQYALSENRASREMLLIGSG